MAHPTSLLIDPAALIHNAQRVREVAPGKQLIAMVKSNAYGCGLALVTSTLAPYVDAFGVASLEEGLALRKTGCEKDCILFQGVFNEEEWPVLIEAGLDSVIHQPRQLEWLLNRPLTQKIKIWVKVDSGMHRLGFAPTEVFGVISSLMQCPWVHSPIGLLSHFACADELTHPMNQKQSQCFLSLRLPDEAKTMRSMANSAAIMGLPEAHFDVVRAGIMLYGVSPFPHQMGKELNLKPVTQLTSAISSIHTIPTGDFVGYGATWQSQRTTRVAVIPVGYGDGFPRHVSPGTLLWVNGHTVPIVGRISMDMLTVDITNYPDIKEGDPVELWGIHVPIEQIAKASGTIAYELLCQITERPIRRVL